MANETNWAAGSADNHLRKIAAEKLTEAKKYDQGKRAHRVDRNTFILIDENATEEQIQDKKRQCRNLISNRK